jgi:tetratricopeptide (TPR) repeat protein
VRTSTANLTLPPFVRGLAAAGEGSAAIDQNLEKLRNVGSNTAIREFEIKALSASMKNDHTKAIELMKNATMLEEQTSAPYGPPSLIKPTHELFGEILLRAGKPAEAAAQFKKALVRQPNRARSLLGAARAAAQSGDAAAATAAYTKFVEQWKQADEGLPELREARHYLDQIKTTKTTN